MNSYTKALFLLALITIANCDIKANLENLKAMMQASQANNAANLAKLQDMMNQLDKEGSSNNSSQPADNSTPASNNTTPVTPAADNATPVTPAADNTTPVTPAANNTAPVADNTTPVANNTAPVSNNTGNSKALFTEAQLEQMMPNSGNNSAYYYSYIIDAMTAGDITSCARMTAFLAQIGHESGSLVYTTEIADGSAYEGITDIGNTSPGDGVKYKGRGLIQVTGKYNYQIVGDGLGYDFVDNPTALATVPYCVTSAVWWWNNHSLSTIADANTQDSFDQTTRIINGGYNGKADRDSRWATAKQVLGC